MPIINEGAKEARQTIKKYQRYLNSPRLVPEQCYRRNHPTYPLISYINQITGLYFSHNYIPIPIFLKRAYRDLNQLNRLNPELVSNEYRNIALQYLCQMAYFITSFHCFEEDDERIKSYIPEELIKAGKQDAKSIEPICNEF